MTQGTIVIAGASGAFGRRAAEAFETAGWEVRRYKRGTDLAELAQGADLIFNGLNPPMYHNWPVLIPQITEQVIGAAKASGATVMVPGNVYVYGDQTGPWTEETPHRPVSRKGRIRAEMEARYARAAAAEGVRVIYLRGGDFVDPANAGTMLNMVVLKGLSKNRITSTGPVDAKRAYAYLPDMARAAVALAERRAELPAYAEVNFPGLTFSLADLRAEIARQTGRRPTVLPFPWPLLRLAAPVHELSKELLEMRYLFRTTHRLESKLFDGLLPGFRLTPFEEVVAEEIAALRAA